jgi:hypothetical protein
MMSCPTSAFFNISISSGEKSMPALIPALAAENCVLALSTARDAPNELSGEDTVLKFCRRSELVARVWPGADVALNFCRIQSSSDVALIYLRVLPLEVSLKFVVALVCLGEDARLTF